MRSPTERAKAMFQLVACNFAVLVIAGVYYAWKDRAGRAAYQRVQLRDRVAYMMWTAAQRG